MTMTYAQIEAKVRTLVNDMEAPYRFPADTIRAFIANAIRHLRLMNPSERYNEAGQLDDALPAPGADGGGDIRFSPRHEEAIVKYAAHKVYELDMTDTVNLQISETLRTRAEALMQL